MKKRALAEAAGFLGILLPGGIGIWIVGRTLAAYWGRDTLASLIVGAIGVALLLGLIESFARHVRAGLIERELRALPATPTDATVDGASPLVSALLRSRLEQVPLPSWGETTAPFLTGLLVMLGLLGTLLGLFQTVHGAGHALTSAPDVEALRRNLSAPIDGLTRSFGCSAAGISASAMLGLAIALVRRREARAWRVFYTYAAGPLRSLSPLRRQAFAFEQLANQSTALPAAAHALEAVGEKLDKLSNELVSLQNTAIKTQQRVFSELLANTRTEIAKASGDAAEALHARVSPLIEQMAARSAEALTVQAAALAESARAVADELNRSAEVQREEAAQHLQALRVRLDAAESVRSAAHAEELESVMALAARAVNEAEQRERAHTERWQDLLGRVDTQLEAARSTESERLRSLDEQVSAARAREGEQLTRLDELSTRVGSELERLSGALSAQLEQRLAHEQQHEARAERAFTQLEATAGALERGITRQEDALTHLVERLPQRFDQAADSARTAAQESLAQLIGVTEDRLSRVSTLLSDELSQRAHTTKAADDRVAEALARVQESASLLDTAIARQGQGLESLIERVGKLLPELTEAAHAGASTTLTQLRASGEQQAERFAELEQAVTRGRDEHARGLADQLTQHAMDLETRLAKTGSAVQEAAAIWQASSAEMQAVAELFASSVERQREASDAWLESLGEVEGAVERAGRDAARDALNEQLAATQEVFAHQLQFQRELFEQLRTLRGDQGLSRAGVAAVATVATVNGEHDAAF
ncbi:MAG: hypothetical protein RL701_6942 [Pseudomonadota bacterium]